MNRFIYVVESIDGDYAHLRTIQEETEDGTILAAEAADAQSEEAKLVARALLPPEIMEGTKLLYEWMQYSIIE